MEKFGFTIKNSPISNGSLCGLTKSKVAKVDRKKFGKHQNIEKF
jgi:hypothetical protein